jgi:hypothetical protein
MADESHQRRNDTGAPTRLHLLTFPYELRHEIYDYLHQRVDITDLAIGDTSYHSFDDRVYKVNGYITPAPIVGVLLICSRTRDEYLKSSVFRNNRLTILKYRRVIVG